jgi:hypothetical protein
MATNILPPVPPQLRNYNGQWPTAVYKYLLRLVAAILANVGGAPLLFAGASNSDPATLIQRIPPGSSDTTDVASPTWGTVMPAAYVINRVAFNFTGSVANVAGQTAELRILVNGVAIYTSTALPTTAGVQSLIHTGIGYAGAAGDQVTVQLVLSATLVTALTLISAGLSS